MNRGRYGVIHSLLDVVLILAILFAMMLAVAIMAINPKAPPAPGPERKAEFIVQMEWPHTSMDDIDLWLLLPSLGTVSFRGKDAAGATLDRDDLGISNDTYVTNDSGETKLIRFNRETTAIRAIMPGRYAVNIQVYATRGSYGNEASEPALPYPVSVKMLKLNPSITEVVNRSVVMEKLGEQRTAFSFTVKDDGTVVDIDTVEQIPFIAIGGTVAP